MSHAQSASRKGELFIRLVTAAALAPVALIAAWLGGPWFAAMLGLAGLLMAREWCAIVHHGWLPQLVIHAAAAVGAAALPGLIGIGAAVASIAALWLASVVASLAVRAKPSPWAFVGVPYVALPVLSLVVLRTDAEFGFLAVVWLFAVVWTADTAAYAAGRTIGGRKLAPAISPGKTWAGLIGAVVGAGLAGGVVATAAGLPALAPVVLIGAGLGIIEQAGDLFESAVKRHYGLKDSGKLIPGHGGMMDRADGLVAAAVVAVIIAVARSGPEHAGTGLLIW